MYKKPNLSTLPPEVQDVLRQLDEEEKLSNKKQKMLGEQIPLNEKSFGCDCKLEQMCDYHGGLQIEKKEFVTFSNPVASGREPNLYRTAKTED